MCLIATRSHYNSLVEAAQRTLGIDITNQPRLSECQGLLASSGRACEQILEACRPLLDLPKRL